MAHFAQLNADNDVIQVIAISNSELLDDFGNESEAKGVAFCQSLFPGTTWKQTSYSASLRKNYASVGFKYDVDRDAFIPPQPYASWTLDEATCIWHAPVPYPYDGKSYRWDEDAKHWEETNAINQADSGAA